MKNRFPHIFLALALAAVTTPMLLAQEDFDAYKAQQLASSDQAQVTPSKSVVVSERQNPPELVLAGGTEDFDAYQAQQLASSAPAEATPSQSVARIDQQNPPEINLTETTRIGDLTLTPGYYGLQYRVHGASHYIHITKEYTVMYVYPESFEIAYHDSVGDVRCQLEALGPAATKTVVKESQEGRMARITELEIKGTAMGHIL